MLAYQTADLGARLFAPGFSCLPPSAPCMPALTGPPHSVRQAPAEPRDFSHLTLRGRGAKRGMLELYLPMFIMFAIAAVICGAMFSLGALLGPKNPTREKM